MIPGLLAYSGMLLYDGGSDIYTRHLLRGTFSEPEFFFPSFGFYIGTSNVIRQLYLLMPHAEWFDSYTVLLLSLLLYSFNVYTNSWSGLQKAIGMTCLVPVLLYPEMTKSSTLLSFLGASFLLNRDGRGGFILGNLLLLSGFTIRTEGGFLGIFLCALAHFSVLRQIIRIDLSMLKRFLLPCLFWGVLNTTLVNFPFTEMDKKYIPIRGYQFALWDFGYSFEQNKPADLQSAMIVEAGMNHFFADPEKINALRLKMAGLIPKDKTISSAAAYLSEPGVMMLKIKTRFLQFKWLLLASFILLAAWSIVQSNYSVLFIFILSVCFFAAFMKLERHLIVPICLCCMIAIGGIKAIHNKFKYIIIAFMSIPWLLVFIADYCQRNQEAEWMESKIADWNQESKEYRLYMDLYTQVKTHIRLFSEPEPIGRWKCFDNAFLFLYPSWQASFGLNHEHWNFKDVVSILKSDLNARFLFHEGKAKFFEQYSYIMYSEKIKWSNLVVWEETSTGLYQIYQH